MVGVETEKWLDLEYKFKVDLRFKIDSTGLDMECEGIKSQG